MREHHRRTCDFGSVRATAWRFLACLLFLGATMLSGQEVSPASSSVFVQARQFLLAGEREKAVALYERHLEDPLLQDEIAIEYAELLASDALRLLQKTPAAKMSVASSAEVLGYLRRARDLRVEEISGWLRYLQTLMTMPKEQRSFLTESQKFFRQWDGRLDAAKAAVVEPLLKEWERRFSEKANPLERWWIVRVRSRGNDQMKSERDALETRIRKRRSELTQRFQELLNGGEFVAADFAVWALQQIDTSGQGLAEMQAKLERVQKIQELLTRAAEALKSAKFDECRSLCQSVFSLDPNNASAREMIKKIDEQQRAPGSDLYGGGRPTTAKPSKVLLETLARAEQEEDFAEVRRVLRELSFQGTATPEHLQRLKDIETEIENSRMNLEARWRDAQQLLERQKWAELRQLLNRNPVFSSPDRLFALEEMGLTCAHFLKLKDADNIQAAADALMKRFPKSFWAPVVLMDQALARNDFVTARKHYEVAVAINPGHAILRWPKTILWLQWHGWKIVPVLLIVVFYIIAHSLPTIFAWLEGLYWPWIRMLVRWAPSMALGSLEGRIGRIRETDQKKRQYELLTQSAFRAGVPDKGVRYAHLTLEIDHENQVAIDALGSWFLGRPEGFAQHLDILVKYLQRHLQDKPVLEKFVQQMLLRRDLKPDMLPIVKKYLAFFPQNAEVISFAAEVLRTWRATDVGREGMELLEKAFQIAGDPDLGRILWRVYVACGMRDQAMALAASIASTGVGIDMIGLLDRLEEDIDQRILFLQQAIMGMEKARQLEAMQAVLEIRHVTTAQAARLIQPLEGFEMEADANVKFHAQKARDHLKRIGLECSTFRERLRALQTAPAEMPSEEPVPGLPEADASESGVSGQHETVAPLAVDPVVESPEEDPASVIAAVFAAPKDPVEPDMPAPETPLASDEEPPEEELSAPSPTEFSISDHATDERKVGSDLVLSDLTENPETVPAIDEPVADTAVISENPDLQGQTGGFDLPALEEAGSEGTSEGSSEVIQPTPATIVSQMEQRLFRDLTDYPYAAPAEVKLSIGRTVPALFDDLPARFKDEPAETGMEDRQPPASSEHDALPETSPSDVDETFVLPGLASDIPETPPEEHGLVSEPSMPPGSQSGVVAEASFDASLSDLILALGEQPTPDQLEHLRLLTTTDDWPAWDEYLRQPHEDLTICSVLQALGSMTVDDSLMRILPFVRHPSSLVRDRAIEILASVGSLDILPELAKRLADQLPEAREGVQRILSGYDPDRLLPEMKNWVESPDTERRDLAIRILKGVRLNESAMMLKSLMYDAEAVLRRNAIRALAFQALPGNARLLNDYLEVCTDQEEEKLITRAIDHLEHRNTDSPFSE